MTNFALEIQKKKKRRARINKGSIHLIVGKIGWKKENSRRNKGETIKLENEGTKWFVPYRRRNNNNNAAARLVNGGRR